MATLFDIIESKSTEDFKEQVKNKLKDGWELHGEMKALMHMDEILYIQAITFQEEEIPPMMQGRFS